MNRLAAIVLAAGSSLRFGAGDKLLADLDGRPVIDHVLDTVTGLGLGQVVVVTRGNFAGLAHLQSDDRLTVVINTRADDGMGVSLATAVAALVDCDGAFVVLADMPFLPSALFHDLAGGLDGHDIVVPYHVGQPGHPVLFGRACFDDLRALDGDRGARGLIDGGRYRVARFATDEAAIHRDIDTVADLRPSGNRRGE